MRMNSIFHADRNVVFHSVSVFLLLAAFLIGLCPVSAVQGQAYIRSGDGVPVAPLDPPIAVRGDYAIVGLEAEEGFSGAAYVLKRRGDTWGELQQLVPRRSEPFAHFGGAVAISAEYAAVGAPWERLFRGAVYVFRRSGDQ